MAPSPLPLQTGDHPLHGFDQRPLPEKGDRMAVPYLEDPVQEEEEITDGKKLFRSGIELTACTVRVEKLVNPLFPGKGKDWTIVVDE